MKKIGISFTKALLLFFFLLTNMVRIHSIETLEIGIGIGGVGVNCADYPPHPPPPKPLCLPPPSPPPPPPSPKPCPKPPSTPSKPSGFEDVRLALAYRAIQKFKATIENDPTGITKTWVGTDICSEKMYIGFYCNTPPDNASAKALAAVDFNGRGLVAGSIASLIDGLRDLAFFHANSNGFRGTIPSSITKLPFFYELDVSNNKMTGAFPSNVLGIKNLTFLDLRFNSFVGNVPPQLFALDIEVLFINDNKFAQLLPPNLGNSPVNYLTLANNRLSGAIPHSIGQAAMTLFEVLFLNNQLTGCLPYEIGFLEEATVFDAGYNKLTGVIPFSFGCLKKVEQLNLAGNRLYGPIPEVVCKLGNLLNLSLSDNYFTAVGPTCWELIERGVLDDRKNCILGRPNQRAPEECTEFFFKPMHCPFPHSSYFIPCELNSSAPAVSASPPSLAVEADPSPSPSYSAIIKNR